MCYSVEQTVFFTLTSEGWCILAKAKANHGAGAIFYIVAMGTLQFLVQEYVTKGSRDIQTKFPFGKGELGETVWATCNREIGEEVQVEPVPVAHLAEMTFTFPRPHDSGEGLYNTHFLLIDATKVDGEIRQNEIKDGTTELGVPHFVPAEEAVADIYRTHQKALAAAIVHLTTSRNSGLGLMKETLEWARRTAAV